MKSSTISNRLTNFSEPYVAGLLWMTLESDRVRSRTPLVCRKVVFLNSLLGRPICQKSANKIWSVHAALFGSMLPSAK